VGFKLKAGMTLANSQGVCSLLPKIPLFSAWWLSHDVITSSFQTKTWLENLGGYHEDFDTYSTLVSSFI
jgi:hypothetical protein